MPRTLRRLLLATAAALYLYFLLPATATMFYELYHLTLIEPLYWAYSGFKIAGYYVGIFDYGLFIYLIFPAAIIALASAITSRRSEKLV